MFCYFSVSVFQVSIEMIKSRYYQTILPYEVTQHLMNSRKFVAKEAFNTGKSSYELINSLPFQDFLQLVENNIPMVFNFAVAINTNEKVIISYIHTTLYHHIFQNLCLILFVISYFYLSCF